MLAAALAASLAALAAVLLAGPASHPQASPSPAHQAATRQAHTPPPARHTPPAKRAAAHAQAGTLPPAAAAAAAFTGDLQAAVADGQVTPQAGHDLFGHLQQLLFGPPGQNPRQIQQQYQQLVQAYDQDQAHGQVTGTAATRLGQALHALGAALSAL